MSILEIWNAVRSGNAEELRLALGRRRKTTWRDLGRRLDNHGWNFLHHATASNSLECVKLVATALRPSCKQRCHEALTPLAAACQRSVSQDIVAFLSRIGKSSINIGDHENMTPLHYAVINDRMDLVQTLVINGANVRAKDRDTETPIDYAAYYTGNVEIFTYLLKAVNYDTYSNLPLFCARARYNVERKIAIFKTLFDLNYRQQRDMPHEQYRFSDIQMLALLSTRSTSLIPYFVSTELRWEQNEIVRFLYEKLRTAEYGFLAILVMCEAKNEELNLYHEVYVKERIKDALIVLAFQSIGNENQEVELLEKLLSYLTVTKSALQDIILPVLVGIMDKLWNFSYVCIEQRCQRVLDCIVSHYMGDLDELLWNEDLLVPGGKNLQPVGFFIRYFSYKFMRPDIADVMCKESAFRTLYSLLGTRRVVNHMHLFDNEPLQCFSLQRIARDAVRMAVFQGMGDVQTPQFNLKYIKRFESLGLPKQLMLYLQYCDQRTISNLTEALIEASRQFIL